MRCFLKQNFSIPEPTPESIMMASVLEAALATPANVLPARYDIAPAKIITGVGAVSFSLSQTSDIRKSGFYELGILTILACLPAGIIISCRENASCSSDIILYFNKN